VTDSPELDTAADERASDADYGEASDVLEEDIGVAGILDVVIESSTSERREVSSMSDRVDVESLDDSRQAPVNVRNVPPVSVVGASDFRSNVSLVPRAEEQQYALSVDASLARVGNPVNPRSVGSGRDQLQQGARI